MAALIKKGYNYASPNDFWKFFFAQLHVFIISLKAERLYLQLHLNFQSFL